MTKVKRPMWIAVEGPIRVGKSTLARLLAERTGARRIVEPENNPFLDKFYKTVPGMAFATQMWFLKERYEQMREAEAVGERAGKKQAVVADYIFEKDKLFAHVNLNDAELALYNRYYDHFRKDLAGPDLVVYLQATPEVLKTRLKRKGIPGERAVSEKYLEKMVEAYEHFFFHYSASDLLVVDTTAIDFVNEPKDLEKMFERIEGGVKGKEYFVPLRGKK